MSEQRPGRPNFRALVSNWREYDAPVVTKLRLALRNASVRVMRRSDCCGHEGEPGCCQVDPSGGAGNHHHANPH